MILTHGHMAAKHAHPPEELVGDMETPTPPKQLKPKHAGKQGFIDRKQLRMSG